MKKNVVDRLTRLEYSITSEGIAECPLHAKMIKAGWTMQDIRDWEQALNLAVKQLEKEIPDFDKLDLVEEMNLTCQRAAELVESLSLLERLAESGLEPSI